eukprot:m.353758 g.353758  ORF g.353758 m.353758 type:complete len:53 (-) comp27996_c0_seq4:1299-1457(-)
MVWLIRQVYCVRNDDDEASSPSSVCGCNGWCGGARHFRSVEENATADVVRQK